LLQVLKWKQQQGGTILKQLRLLGASLDWSRGVFLFVFLVGLAWKNSTFMYGILFCFVSTLKFPCNLCSVIFFTGAFFNTCWETIKVDVTVAINTLFVMNSQGLDLLNSANIILLPKKADAMRVTDYRPISLIHSIAKLFSKLLANRLAPLLDSLVSKCFHQENEHS